MSHQPHNTNAPAEATGAIVGQLLSFLGLMTTVGAALTILIRAGHSSVLFDARDIFYAMLMPIGLAAWWFGRTLDRRARHARHDDEADHG